MKSVKFVFKCEQKLADKSFIRLCTALHLNADYFFLDEAKNILKGYGLPIWHQASHFCWFLHVNTVKPV